MAIEYYNVLGISEKSGISEIKAAYRRLAKKYHPDICDLPDAKEKFILVNEAYEFLIKLKTNPPIPPGCCGGNQGPLTAGRPLPLLRASINDRFVGKTPSLTALRPHQ